MKRYIGVVLMALLIPVFIACCGKPADHHTIVPESNVEPDPVTNDAVEEVKESPVLIEETIEEPEVTPVIEGTNPYIILDSLPQSVDDTDTNEQKPDSLKVD